MGLGYQITEAMAGTMEVIGHVHCGMYVCRPYGGHGG